MDYNQQFNQFRKKLDSLKIEINRTNIQQYKNIQLQNNDEK